MLTLLAFSFFCLLTLGAPDSSLVASDASIEVPFADVEVSFVSFLTIGPLILIGLTIYLHIFLGQLWSLTATEIDHGRALPYLFNLRNPFARLVAGFVFYWLTPIVLGVFAWKALPRPEAPIVIGTTAGVTAVLLWLQIRRARGLRRRWQNPVLWLLMGSLLVVAVDTGWREATDDPPRLSRRLDLFKASLSGQDLRSANLNSAIMIEANLAGADLRSAELINADLRSANLDGAKLGLTRTDLDALEPVAAWSGGIVGALEAAFVPLALYSRPAANLSKANLAGAVLDGAVLGHANLRNADLRRARLRNAMLRKATLWEASLFGADLEGADLARADLRGTRGLSCETLAAANGWQRAYRDAPLACGAEIPRPPTSRAEPPPDVKIFRAPVGQIGIRG